jgi:hypothetical protein
MPLYFSLDGSGGRGRFILQGACRVPGGCWMRVTDGLRHTGTARAADAAWQRRTNGLRS